MDYKLRGRLQVYKQYKDGNREKVIDKSNLIVYNGREWVVVRLFNYDNPSISPTKDMFISWVSFGSGGAPASDPLNPIPPTNNDTSLANEIVIDSTNPDYADGGRKIPINTYGFAEDVENDNRLLIGEVDVLLDQDTLNGVDINEMGIWLSNSRVASEVTDLQLFARVTFPTQVKREDYALQFIWLLYA